MKRVESNHVKVNRQPVATGKQTSNKRKKPVEKHPYQTLTEDKGLCVPWTQTESLKRVGYGAFRVGTSGYVYEHWKGIVYPTDVSHKKWFALYTSLFDTVEINYSFYHLPSEEVIDSWKAQAPSGFCYALKFSRFGTHMKRLKDPEGPISLFVDRVARLGQNALGPFLVQLPPKFKPDLERLKNFLERLPDQYRWAIEFRDKRWLCDDVFSLLRSHNIPMCIHDHIDIPKLHPKVLTANWTYIRFHGRNYQRQYTHDELQTWSIWIKGVLEMGHDVYAYFNNDFKGYAAYNALELRDMVFT
ncbi:hypothetical protein KP509_29G001700 [Ceratopteris richardii]|nr:hypothetical protein KP509_29G001700 [Ceratopteris richardii]KAH7291130.1 hypothetical protein KP509_29G001700 [Ceratopteris richardii]